MATVTKLAGNIKAVKEAGFIKAPQYDFEDDGANFTGYSFDGVPLTQTTYKKEVFLSVRFDYLVSGIPYDFYKSYCSGIATDKYNGTFEQVDLEDLANICKQAKMAAAKCHSDFKALKVDTNKVLGNLEAGLKLQKDALTFAQSVFPFELGLSSSGIREFQSNYENLKKGITKSENLIKAVKANTMEQNELYRLERAKVEEGYWAESLRKLINGNACSFYYTSN